MKSAKFLMKRRERCVKMYKYELKITMSDGGVIIQDIGMKEDRMLDDEKNCHINKMFRNEHIDFSDYIKLYVGNDYVVLNTRQITSIGIRETMI